MSYHYNGTDIFALCEWSGSATKHAIANSGYKLYGQTLEQFGRAPVTTTTGYLYSGETFTPTGYKLAGTQVVLQNPGCRPRTAHAVWSSGGAGTSYIHRYTDGGANTPKKHFFKPNRSQIAHAHHFIAGLSSLKKNETLDTQGFRLARRRGFEPPTFWFVAKHSIRLSYRRTYKK